MSATHATNEDRQLTVSARCPIQEGKRVSRGFWRFGTIAKTGLSYELKDGAWVCPVKFKNGDFGIVISRVLMRGNGRCWTYALEFKTNNSVVNRAIRRSSHMPEIILWDDQHGMIGCVYCQHERVADIVLKNIACAGSASLHEAG